MNCSDVKTLIDEMFSNFSPFRVDVTRAFIDPHLLRCKLCRDYLKAKYAEKKKRFENGNRN